MSKIVEIKVNYGRTISVKSYESIRLDVELRAVINEDEDTQEALDDLQAYAASEVKKWADHEIKALETKKKDPIYRRLMNETKAEDYY